ncbi:MAG: caspase family protein, partial [Pirellulaceae bacterium]
MKYAATSLATTFLLLAIMATSSLGDEIPMYALVIGNSQYSTAPLKNPVNDAKLMESTLAELGFQVTVKSDLTHEQMDVAISEFAAGLPRGSVAFFFFAGHGVQDRNQRNYLIPTDAKLSNESSIKYQTVALDYVMDALDGSQSNLNVVILDCCRDNPFERSWARSINSRGLASIDAPEGTIIAYSTAKGATASDGDGNNSAYTSQLAAALKAGPGKGEPLVDIFRTASQGVSKIIGQRPFLEFDASMPNFFFPSTKVATAQPPAINTASVASTMPPPITNLPSTESSKDLEPSDPPLLRQAVTFSENRQFDYAIESYAALISDPTTSPAVRTRAYRGRGEAYLGRRSGGADINRAIIDFKAAKQRGVSLAVMTDEAAMKDSDKVLGKVFRNEIVLLTQSRGDWLWV